jgi:signal peptidase I
MILTVRRRFVIWLLFGVIAVVLTTARGASSMGAASDTGPPVDGARAIAFAQAVNLRASDVRGLVGARVGLPRGARVGPFGTAVERCDGGVAQPGDVFGVVSRRFTRENVHRSAGGVSSSFLPIESVYSGIYLVASSAMASHEIEVSESARRRSCIKRILEAQRLAREPFFAHVHVSAVPSPLKGIPGYGLQATAVVATFLHAPHVTGRPNYYEGFFGFAVGQAIITLHTTGSPRPFPSATERRLLSLLYERAEASSGILSLSSTIAPVRVYRVPSGSMEPTLSIGESVLAKEGPPAVGAIVVFHPPEGAEMQECGPKPHVVKLGGAACDAPVPVEDSGVDFIKRVVAGPGDEIYIREGHVYRKAAGSSDFVPESDAYIRPCDASPECAFPDPIEIPAGDWFVMGDNRGESDDSRFWGPVPTAWIVGVVTEPEN